MRGSPKGLVWVGTCREDLRSVPEQGLELVRRRLRRAEEILAEMSKVQGGSNEEED
jgi:hypothetical protein